jgi:hypothetical protein
MTKWHTDTLDKWLRYPIPDAYASVWSMIIAGLRGGKPREKVQAAIDQLLDGLLESHPTWLAQ